MNGAKLNEIARQDVDEILREAPDRRGMAEQLMWVQVDASVIPVPIVEVPLNHQHPGFLQVLQCLLPDIRLSIHRTPCTKLWALGPAQSLEPEACLDP